MQPSHRTADEGEPDRSLRRRAVRNFGFLVAAVTLTVVAGLVAGWLFAKGSPKRAATTLVGQFVVGEESIGSQPPASDAPAPTSGRWTDGSPRCGRAAEPVAVEDQLATIATGAVIIQYRPEAAPDDALLDELARRPDVLVAPNPDLPDPVVATSWTQRMELPEATSELLFAFATGHRGFGPEARAECPVVAGR